MISDIDRAAMGRAVTTVRQQSPARAKQIFDMLSSRPLETVGRFASFSCQMDSLHLDPWETPPCWITNVDAR
jgi:hypothetical protein